MWIWTYLLTWQLGLFYLMMLFVFTFHAELPNLIDFVNIPVMLVLFTCALTLLYKPFVLYGIDFDLTDKSDKQAKKEIENKFSLTEEQMLDYEERITSFFENERPFLKQNYKIKQLSEDIDIPAHHLSLFINEKYDLSYSNFVNRARIDHIVAVFGNEKSKQLTLEGLAKESGFNSRNTFIRAFKKYLGQTPSEYFQS